MQDNPHLHQTIVKHHQSYERGKLLRQERVSDANRIRATIHRHKQCVIPITFDPGGQFGPLTTALLWHPSKRPNTALHTSTPLTQLRSTQPTLCQAICTA
jgi:hypothetical protein